MVEQPNASPASHRAIGLGREDREMALHAIAWAGSLKPEFSRPIITPFVIPTVMAALWAVLRDRSTWPDAVSEAGSIAGAGTRSRDNFESWKR